MLYSNTNSVQSFVRTLAWLITFIVMSVVLGSGMAGVSALLFQSTTVLLIPTLIFNAWVAGIVSKMFFILPEWERIVILRLGKFHEVKGPGYFVIPPFVYSVASIVDTRIETYQVEATATLTKDNVPTKVTAAIEYRVEDPKRATVDVQNYRQTIVWVSTEALKNTIGSLELKELLSDRDKISENLKLQIDADAATYGIDVRAVRLTDIDTPSSLVEELAVIARERRASEAKQIQAAAEIHVARMIAEASDLLNQSNGGLRLRELQLLAEMSKNESTMVIVYPYGDRDAKEIANGAAGRITQKGGVDVKQL